MLGMGYGSGLWYRSDFYDLTCRCANRVFTYPLGNSNFPAFLDRGNCSPGWNYFFAYEGSRLFVTTAVIKVEPEGTWHLYAPAGNKIASLSPDMRRSLLLWAEVNSYKTSPYFDSLYGIIRTANGKEYSLKISGSFDLLISLGYGPYWLDHDNLTLSEEKDVKTRRAQMVYAGNNKKGGIILPEHSYDSKGISAVQAFLFSRAR